MIPFNSRDSVQFTTDPSAFGCDLFACFLTEHHHESNEFEGSEQAVVVVLPINHDVVIRRQKLLTDTREGLLVKFLTSLTQQIDLKKVIGQHDKDDLVDDHREGSGGKMGQVAKTLELTIPLLCGGTQMVLLPGLTWILDLLGVD